MKTALITGSAGFVGRHMHQRLLDDGYAVDAVDIVTGDDCLHYFTEYTDHGPDLVVHCAAFVGGREGIDGSPLKVGALNLELDSALFRWAMAARPRRIVYFSSSAAYPLFRQSERWHAANPDERLIEAMIWHGDGFGPEFDPDTTYGWSKVAGELLAHHANIEGIATHVFRPFSGYGTDQSNDYPFPAFVARAKAHQSPFPVWGSTLSGRDWIHIDDVVNAVMAALERDVRGPVNLCTGIGTTFGRLAELCMQGADHVAPIVENHGAPQGAFWRVGDPTMMHEFYKPQISLEEGVWRAMRGAP